MYENPSEEENFVWWVQLESENWAFCELVKNLHEEARPVSAQLPTVTSFTAKLYNRDLPAMKSDLDPLNLKLNP